MNFVTLRKPVGQDADVQLRVQNLEPYFDF